jgi:hypothetical protein
MAGTIVADNIQAASTSTLVLKNGVANTPPTVQDSGGTEIGTFCRAWVNFNGTGTVAIRASFNVSSITDNGTGDYTVNFTTAMPDVNYSTVCTVTPSGTLSQSVGVAEENSVNRSKTTTSVPVSAQLVNASTTAQGFDSASFSVAIFR